MSKKWVLWSVFGVAILVILAQFALPAWVSGYAAQSLKELTASETVTVKAEKQPALLMMTGEFDQVTVQAVNAKLDRLTFRTLDASLTQPKLDMNSLLTQHKFVLQSVQKLEVTGVVDAAELARFLDNNVKGSKNAVVTITPDKVTVSTNLALGPIPTLTITLEGKIVSDGQKLKFVTEHFLLNHSPVGNLGGALLTEIPLFDLKKLPFGTTIQQVVQKDGQIEIQAGN